MNLDIYRSQDDLYIILGGRIVLLVDERLRKARTMEEILMSPDLHERELVRDTSEHGSRFDHDSEFPFPGRTP